METARKGYPDPENFDNPMIAPQDYEFHQSGRVLELQNRGGVTCEVGSQRGEDRGSQEAEDLEK